jgi:hypothetical protein
VFRRLGFWHGGFMFLKREPDAQQQGHGCRQRPGLAGLHQFSESFQFSRFHPDTIHLQAIGQGMDACCAHTHTSPESVDEPPAPSVRLASDKRIGQPLTAAILPAKPPSLVSKDDQTDFTDSKFR